ncbi:hypothetical protein QR680_003083 [Steinernema hermaphroditum]|uniref:Uncharacterized protein n=1 Tax=Steinernema hermaphroditum TaxID=289476 RepID=A0AA39H5A4_9BILA|nr:hypothetical protein QR680_003083 [Steinernema hermaphroditum]
MDPSTLDFSLLHPIQQYILSEYYRSLGMMTGLQQNEQMHPGLIQQTNSAFVLPFPQFANQPSNPTPSNLPASNNLFTAQESLSTENFPALLQTILKEEHEEHTQADGAHNSLTRPVPLNVPALAHDDSLRRIIQATTVVNHLSQNPIIPALNLAVNPKSDETDTQTTSAPNAQSSAVSMLSAASVLIKKRGGKPRGKKQATIPGRRTAKTRTRVACGNCDESMPSKPSLKSLPVRDTIKPKAKSASVPVCKANSEPAKLQNESAEQTTMGSTAVFGTPLMYLETSYISPEEVRRRYPAIKNDGGVSFFPLMVSENEIKPPTTTPSLVSEATAASKNKDEEAPSAAIVGSSSIGSPAGHGGTGKIVLKRKANQDYEISAPKKKWEKRWTSETNSRSASSSPPKLVPQQNAPTESQNGTSPKKEEKTKVSVVGHACAFSDLKDRDAYVSKIVNEELFENL